MANTWIRPMLVAVLCFSYLICFNGAIPVTRTTNLMQKSETANQVRSITDEKGSWESSETEALATRLELMELNDYPGSGANNRHTPRPQLGRGCIDC